MLFFLFMKRKNEKLTFGPLNLMLFYSSEKNAMSLRDEKYGMRQMRPQASESLESKFDDQPLEMVTCRVELEPKLQELLGSLIKNPANTWLTADARGTAERVQSLRNKVQTLEAQKKCAEGAEKELAKKEAEEKADGGDGDTEMKEAEVAVEKPEDGGEKEEEEEDDDGAIKKNYTASQICGFKLKRMKKELKAAEKELKTAVQGGPMNRTFIADVRPLDAEMEAKLRALFSGCKAVKNMTIFEFRSKDSPFKLRKTLKYLKGTELESLAQQLLCHFVSKVELNGHLLDLPQMPLTRAIRDTLSTLAANPKRSE